MKHSVGRSMVEMLGVLAVVGVLSIGGLVAYRQAMIRYKTNQTLDFIARLQLAVKTECVDKESCVFYEKGGIARFADNYRILCGLYGDDFCGKIVGTEMAFFAFYPHGGVPERSNPRWRFRMIDVSWYFIDLNTIHQGLCINLVNYSWKDLKTIIVRNVYKYPINGILTSADKEDLVTACQQDAYPSMSIRWNLKN